MSSSGTSAEFIEEHRKKERRKVQQEIAKSQVMEVVALHFFCVYVFCGVLFPVRSYTPLPRVGEAEILKLPKKSPDFENLVISGENRPFWNHFRKIDVF